MRDQLPSFIEPMLAISGDAFDSDDHLFEIKWDGTRALCFVDHNGLRLMNRRARDTLERYPDLSFLKRLPKGTILDGEIVVLRGGVPDFQSLQVREQSRTAPKIAAVTRSRPATYIAFDLLYDDYRNVMNEPLLDRRQRAQALIKDLGNPYAMTSTGITASGRAYFNEAVKRGLEGIMAKDLASRYLPGKRSPAWIKIKRQQTLPVIVIGFVPEGNSDFSALIIACETQGELVSVGKVGSGFTDSMRNRINRFLWANLRPKPVIHCRMRGLWVEPRLYCTVRCMERTTAGQLRAPVFGGLYGSHD